MYYIKNPIQNLIEDKPLALRDVFVVTKLNIMAT